MDVETWCTQNNLTKANYYYRLRRVRQICLDQMQDTETTAFVELPAPAPDPKKTDTLTLNNQYLFIPPHF